jgi:pyruvate/2-oxoglutarate dehydrogenase complex dihydrolipoamide acyltransferase (E2) component
MSAEIIMPQLGETVAEGKILSWFKRIGDTVKLGDRLFEVETDKVTVDVEAVSAGTLTEIRTGDGASAKVGMVVAVLDGGTPKLAAAAPLAGLAASAPTPSPMRSPYEETATPLGNYGGTKSTNGVRMSPLARRLAAERGIAPQAIAEAAARQDIRRIDRQQLQTLFTAVSTGGLPAVVPQPQQRPPVLSGEILTLNTIRQRTGDRLAENWRTIPHVFQAVEADFTNVEAARAVAKERFKAENGTSLTYLPFIARAVCMAMAAYPQVNARFDGKSLAVSREVHLGIAVDLNHNGLVVPVIRDAGDLTTLGLAKAIARVADTARSGKLGPDDMAGGTYSISNNGAFGTLFTTPIINAPQVAILSVDAIAKRPAVVATDEGDFVAARLMGMLGQSFDHRAFDGAYAAAFLARLKSIIETRDWSAELVS